MLRRFLLGCLICAISTALTPSLFAAGKARHFVLVVWDGMRPEFVTPELTPALYALRSEGVWFANHHSAYPTSTEVNGAVLATGVFPQRNGILANKEYRREIDPLKEFQTQALKAVRRGDQINGGKYLAVPTLAELVQAQGLTTAMVGAKPVALLHDRRARGDDASSAVWFVDGCLPESRFATLTNRFGPFPATASPNTRRDEWARRCLTEAFWERGVPRYSMLWLSEPDFSQHRHGPGSAKALEAIRSSDKQLAALLRELERRGVRQETDVVVVSDHGFSTIGGGFNTTNALQLAGINARVSWKQPPVDDDVVVVGNGGSVLIYVVGHSPRVIEKIVTTLQRQPAAGVLFTRDGLPGTFALSEVKLAGSNAPDVVLAMHWTMSAQPTARGGATIVSSGYSEYGLGGGMHVTLSPSDLRNLAVACGPDFRKGATNSLPSGNVDIVPTLMWLMGIEPPSPLDGRVLSESLAVENPPPTGLPAPGQRKTSVDLSDGAWTQHLKFTELNGVRYLEEGNGTWTPLPAKSDASLPEKKGD